MPSWIGTQGGRSPTGEPIQDGGKNHAAIASAMNPK
jgi:hypothetical protein